ncbi:hypothetical protein H0H93_009649, partial [Arthromyces matolae]
MKFFSFSSNSFNNARQLSKAGNSNIGPQVTFGVFSTIATIAFYGFGQQPVGRLDGAAAYQVASLPPPKLPPPPPPSKTTPSLITQNEPFSYYPLIAGVMICLFVGTVTLVMKPFPRKKVPNALNRAGHDDGRDKGNGNGNDNDGDEPKSPEKDADIGDEEDPEYPGDPPEDPPPPPPPATVDADEPPPPNSWSDMFDWLLRLLFCSWLVCKRACHYVSKMKASSRRVALAKQDIEIAVPPPENSTMRRRTPTPSRHVPRPDVYRRPRTIRTRPTRSNSSTSSHVSRASPLMPPLTASVMNHRRTVSPANPFGALEILGLVGLGIRVLFLVKDIISLVRNSMRRKTRECIDTSNESPSSAAIFEEDKNFAIALRTPLPDDNKDDFNLVPDNDESAPTATTAVEFTPAIVHSTALPSDQHFDLVLPIPLPGDTGTFDDTTVVEVSPSVFDLMTSDTLLDLASKTSLPADGESDWDLSLSVPLPEDDGDAFDDLVIACSIPLPVDEDNDLVEEDEDTLELALLTPLPADGDSDWDLSLSVPLPEDDGDAFDDLTVACSIPLPVDE